MQNKIWEFSVGCLGVEARITWKTVKRLCEKESKLDLGFWNPPSECRLIGSFPPKT